MKVFHCDSFDVPLPDGHRFPMEKYRLLREAVERMRAEASPDSALARIELSVPPPATDEELARAHDPAYLKRLHSGTLSPAEVRRIGFPWSRALVERSRRSVGGTVQAARAALREGVAVNLSGGTHHAFPGRGEGFCLLNDVAVAVRALQAEAALERLAILDLDVHQGNGTAAAFKGDPHVFTLSVHGANNFPFRKVPSRLDLDLPDGASDAEYLAQVERGLTDALGEPRPELAFFLAGADPYRGDRLGRLAVTREGLAQRDRMVLEGCRAAGTPLAIVMSGGYASPIEDTVAIHLTTVRLAAEAAARFSEPRPS